MNGKPSYYRYWGKAGKGDDRSCHLLPYHCLDVAAVAEALLSTDSRVLQALAIPVGHDDHGFQALVCLFVALHDLGKFSDSFQSWRPDLVQQLGRPTAQRLRRDARHDSLGLLAWREIAWLCIREGGTLCDSGAADDYAWRDDALGPLVSAVMGHHGKPCEETDRAQIGLRIEEYFTADNRAAVAEFVRALTFLLPAAPRPLLHWKDQLPAGARPVSWLLAGLAVMADWIGSNETLFPRRRDVMPLDEYWRNHALPQAREAVRACGVPPATASGRDGMAWLFPKIPCPSPLQQLTERVPLGNGPQLFVIEDLTGAGKTEAALVLAQRLVNQGAAHGFYMGLPTMATANAMFERVLDKPDDGVEVYRRFYADSSQPCLILAHSHRQLSDLFRNLTQAAGPPWLGHEDDEDEGGATGRAWLADNRKKSLNRPAARRPPNRTDVPHARGDEPAPLLLGRRSQVRSPRAWG